MLKWCLPHWFSLLSSLFSTKAEEELRLMGNGALKQSSEQSEGPVGWTEVLDTFRRFSESALKMWKVFRTEPASCSNSLLRPFSSSVSSSGGLGMGGCRKKPNQSKHNWLPVWTSGRLAVIYLHLAGQHPQLFPSLCETKQTALRTREKTSNLVFPPKTLHKF